MSIGVILAAAVLAQAADAPAATPPAAEPATAYGPEVPPPPRIAASAEPARKDCSPKAPDPNSDTIVVCVERSDGYRIDPDVLSAKKAKRDANHGRPVSRSEQAAADSSCAVGPHACVDTGINLLAVALTAAQMAERLSKGQEIGSMFVTDPEASSEYQYYQQAKHEREKREGEAADQAYAAQLDAEAAAAKAGQSSADEK